MFRRQPSAQCGMQIWHNYKDRREHGGAGLAHSPRQVPQTVRQRDIDLKRATWRQSRSIFGVLWFDDSFDGTHIGRGFAPANDVEWEAERNPAAASTMRDRYESLAVCRSARIELCRLSIFLLYC
jgi:hypothetical protein